MTSSCVCWNWLRGLRIYRTRTSLFWGMAMMGNLVVPFDILLGTSALPLGACPRLRRGTGTVAARLSSPKSDGTASPPSEYPSHFALAHFRDEPSRIMRARSHSRREG
jgi:hypothetical protein